MTNQTVMVTMSLAEVNEYFTALLQRQDPTNDLFTEIDDVSDDEITDDVSDDEITDDERNDILFASLVNDLDEWLYDTVGVQWLLVDLSSLPPEEQSDHLHDRYRLISDWHPQSR